MAAQPETPNGAEAGWQFRGSEIRFENELCRLRDDEVELEGGKKINYAYLERDEAVIIVPVTSAGDVILLKQYRYPVDEWCLEVPAGGTHDSGDASLEEVVRKELREEVGATAKSLTHVGSFYSCNSMSDEKCHVYLAEGVELTKEQRTESSEEIKVQLVSVEKAIEMARSGAMKTGPCALAVLFCEPLLSKLGHHRPTPDHLLET